MKIVTYRETQMDKGKYVVIIVRAEDGGTVETYNGEMRKTVNIEYEVDRTGQKKKQRYIAYASQTSQLGKLLIAVYGDIPDSPELEDLVDKRIVIEIGHKKSSKNQRIYSNVVDYLSINKIRKDEVMNPEALEDYKGIEEEC